MSDRGATAWQSGAFQGDRSELLFGRMYEDAAVELSAFAPGGRVFCIASAGCTARALAAAGHRVIAVDINPQQLAYARSVAEGAPERDGAAERLMARGRALLALAGWSEARRRAFLDLDEPSAQVGQWDRQLDTRRWRVLVDALLSPWLLRLVYAGPLVDSLPAEFGRLIRERLRRAWATHSNRTNPYARSLLLGDRAPRPGPPIHPICFASADAAAFLESCPPSSFDAFSMSNILDGASTAYAARLERAIRGAAARGAVVVSRSFAEPHAGACTDSTVADRSLLWGVVDVRRLEDN